MSANIFGTFKAAERYSTRSHQGERIESLGPSGSGKIGQMIAVSTGWKKHGRAGQIFIGDIELTR